MSIMTIWFSSRDNTYITRTIWFLMIKPGWFHHGNEFNTPSRVWLPEAVWSCDCLLCSEPSTSHTAKPFYPLMYCSSEWHHILVVVWTKSLLLKQSTESVLRIYLKDSFARLHDPCCCKVRTSIVLSLTFPQVNRVSSNNVSHDKSHCNHRVLCIGSTVSTL